jgi:hypothetical protein
MLAAPSGHEVRPAVSVDELKRAWFAVQSGDFRRTPRPARGTIPATRAPAAIEWSPATEERVIPVIGAAGNVGASTVALALATVSTRPARVVECCPPAASGLAAASTAELGVTLGGASWRQGRRDQVLIERTTGPHTAFDDVPSPTPAEYVDMLTILDAGDATHLANATGWLPAAVRAVPCLVIVTTATIPGFRRLEAALELLGLGPTRVAVAVVGPVRRKWPRSLERSAGPAVRRLLDESRVVEVAHDRTLGITGVDSRPLPRPVVAAAAALLTLTGFDADRTT